MGILVSIRNSLLGYSDANGEVNNPLQKQFDWNRQYLNIPVDSATSDSMKVPAGGSVTLFDGVRILPSALVASTTQVSLSVVDSRKSIYRLSISGAGAFRTERALGITAASVIQVTINNGANATFAISGAGSFSSIQTGDIVRIPGLKTGDPQGAFSSINSGYWVVLTANATSLTAKRQPGTCFEGVNETVTIGATDTANQFRAYSQSGIQLGDSFAISGTLNPIAFRDYDVLAVGPDFVDFVSGIPLPVEGPLALGAVDDIVFYTDAKRLIYIEVNQRAVVKYNNQQESANQIDPVIIGSEKQPGFSMKFGHAYKCVVENKSDVDPMDIKWILGE